MNQSSLITNSYNQDKKNSDPETIIFPDRLYDNDDDDAQNSFHAARKSGKIISLGRSIMSPETELESDDLLNILGRVTSENIVVDIEMGKSNDHKQGESSIRNVQIEKFSLETKISNGNNNNTCDGVFKIDSNKVLPSKVTLSPPAPPQVIVRNPMDPEIEVHIDDDDDEDDQINVDEMKVKSVYTMIEDCKIRTGSLVLPKKLLYLTNRQASVFDESIMGRFIEALDIGEPKLVIILLGGSFGFRSQMLASHKEVLGTKEELFNPMYLSSNIDMTDEESYRSQVINFMKNSILPIALQTEAIILISGSNECFLSSIFSEVALAEQAKYGNRCPFKVIALAFEVQVHLNATNKITSNSVSGQLFNQSKAWKKRADFTSEFWKNFPGMNLPRSDLTSSASRYVIFEGIYEEIHKDELRKKFRRCRKDISARIMFSETLLGYLAKKLPTIAFFSNQLGAPIAYMHDLIHRGIPVVLLDGRERCLTSNTVSRTDTMETKLARESCSFPTISTEQQSKIEQILLSSDPVHKLEGGIELMSIGEGVLHRHWQCFIEHSLTDCWNVSTLSFLRSLVWSASGNEFTNRNLLKKRMANKTLHERIQELEKLENSNVNSLMASSVPLALVRRAISFFVTTSQVYGLLAHHKYIDTWLLLNAVATNSSATGITEQIFYKDALQLKSKLENQLRVFGVSESDIINHCISYHTIKPLDQADVSDWLSYYVIFTYPNVYSVSIYNSAEVNLIVNSITKVDRLPDFDTLQSLRQLQESWDYIEMYHLSADTYKCVAKGAFISLLLLGVLITLLAILNQAYNYPTRVAIIALGFSITAISAYISFMNPAVRWQNLRIAALDLESNIWLYRTRVGQYSGVLGRFDKKVEDRLGKSLLEVKDKVIKVADIKSTTFFARKKSLNQHRQHSQNEEDDENTNYFQSAFRTNSYSKQHREEHKSVSERNISVRLDEYLLSLKSAAFNYFHGELVYQTSSQSSSSSQKFGDSDIDNHFEPLHPERYIKFRVKPLISFYQSRIPTKVYTRYITQSFTILGSIAITAVAIFDQNAWVPLITVSISAVAAFVEYSGISGKVDRYSTTIHGLEGVLSWWKEITPIEQSSVDSIEFLVLTCEDIIKREQQAWKSTNQALKVMNKTTQAQSNNTNDTSDSEREESRSSRMSP